MDLWPPMTDRRRPVTRGWVARQPIEGDLSRADLLYLYDHCRDRTVVEVGSGGSTAMLARFVRRLVSFETDTGWFLAVRKRLRERGMTHVELLKVAAKPDQAAPFADVYIIDCASADQLRSRWLDWVVRGRLAPTVLLHDSRRESPTNEIGWLWKWPSTARLESAHFHEADSNYIRLQFRGGPVQYVNWQSEPGRQPLRRI